MKVMTESIRVTSRGHSDVIDITSQVAAKVKESGTKRGNVTVFVAGSTACVTTIEYEPGLQEDLSEALEKIAPEGKPYHHDARWGDRNGSSHVRAALMGPSLTVPYSNGELLLGTWQQIVLVDCDTRPRTRDLVLNIIGE